MMQLKRSWLPLGDLWLALGGGHSQLFLQLMSMLAWGTLSGPHIQVISQCAWQDGALHSDVQAMASIGASGAWAGNTRRDLLRLVHRNFPLQVPKPLIVELPFLKKKHGGNGMATALHRHLRSLTSFTKTSPLCLKICFATPTPKLSGTKFVMTTLVYMTTQC